MEYMMKRCLDVVFACIGLLLVLPLFPVIGLFLKLDSRGPILYRCDRIGKDGKLFKMYKFRTMLETTVPVWASISPQDDPRVAYPLAADNVLRPPPCPLIGAISWSCALGTAFQDLVQ